MNHHGQDSRHRLESVLMVTIVVASKNPVKIQSALNGFQAMFPGHTYEARSVSVPSGVSDQPMSSAETLHGALTRLDNAQQAAPDANFWVGIEGGVEEDNGLILGFAWIIVRSLEMQGMSRTATFTLPPEVATLVRQGVELGDADDRVFGRSNSKQQNGAVGILTGDVMNRTQLYEHAMILALIPFKNPHLYQK